MDFDTEKFIIEIQERPAIWNSKCSEYVDKKLKRKSWYELVDIYGEELNKVERKELCSTLQKKWRNIRDSFVKAHRAKVTKLGCAARKKVPYVFYENLLFLKDTVPVYTIAELNTQNESGRSSMSSRAPKKRKTSKNEGQDNEKKIEIVDKDRERKFNTLEGDEDRLFFLSLVNEFKKIPDQRRMQAKVDILKVINDAQMSGYPAASWDYPFANVPCEETAKSPSDGKSLLSVANSENSQSSV